MQSSRCLLPAGRRLRGSAIRHLGAQARAARDRAGADGRAVLVTLVKADAEAAPLNILQAQKILRLDVCRRILTDLTGINQAHLWGFRNSSSKTADVESDVLMTLRNIGVPKPRQIYKNQELAQLEERLSCDTSLVVDLTESEESSENATPTVKSFLQTQHAELLRLSTLLDTGASTEQAEGAMLFYRSFLAVVDDHIANDGSRHHAKSKEPDCNILQLVKEQETAYRRHLSDFETRPALDVLWQTMLLVKQRVQAGGVTSPIELLAVRESLVGHLEKLGVSLLTEETLEPALDGRLAMVIDAAAAFRREVRRYALLDLSKRKELMTACDGVRDSLLQAGVKLQDKKNQTLWLWAATKK